MSYYARGAVARENRDVMQRQVRRIGVRPPRHLAPGYYLVSKDYHWRIARWCPQSDHWEIGGGFQWPATHWDEIGGKVA